MSAETLLVIAPSSLTIWTATLLEETDEFDGACFRFCPILLTVSLKG